MGKRDDSSKKKQLDEDEMEDFSQSSMLEATIISPFCWEFSNWKSFPDVPMNYRQRHLLWYQIENWYFFSNFLLYVLATTKVN